MPAVRLAKLEIMQRLTRMLAEPYSFDYVDLDGARTYTFTPSDVYRGRKTVSSAEAKYAISILEAPRATIGSPAGVEGEARLADWTLNIQGWPPEDRVNPSDPAYLMAGAVRQRLARIIARVPDDGISEPVYGEDYLFDGLASKVSFGETIVTPATDGLSEVAFWYMPVVVSLVQRTTS